MALTGNTVQSTYLDLCQLEKGGAGLPSHAGKEAALYDGSGAQILGRTAVRNWLDPDPDAIAGTWEFSTYGDATQGELETAGWTFTNFTAKVVNGLMVLTKTAAYDTLAKAELTVSLSGDFDYVVGWQAPTVSQTIRSGNLTQYGLFVADSSGSAHGACVGLDEAGRYEWRLMKAATYANLNGGTASNGDIFTSCPVMRVFKKSGTVTLLVGDSMASLYDNSGDLSTWGWGCVPSTQADASTFNKLILVDDAGGKTYPQSHGYAFVRKYS